MFKEEKRSVGRPKLADTKLKKQSLIMLVVCLAVVLTLLFTGAYKLNIIKFNRLKGELACTEIPLNMQPRSESNPEGVEHGFTDINFYTAVINAYAKTQKLSSINYCERISVDKLSIITELLAYDKNISDVSGIQYLTGLKRLSLSNNNITSIDLSNNSQLTRLDLSNTKLSELDISNIKNINIGSGDSFLATNTFDKTYNIKLGDTIDIETGIIKTPYESYYGMRKYFYDGAGVAKLDENIVTALKPGKTTLLVHYQWGSEDRCSFPIKYTINVLADEFDDAYLRAGFTNENTYSCVVKSIDSSLSEKTYLPPVTLNNIKILYCPNSNLENVDDLRLLPNLEQIDLSNNNISTINLVENTKIISINILDALKSNTEYILKGEQKEYIPLVLNDIYNTVYTSLDENIVKYENGKIFGVKEGTTNIELTNNSIQTNKPTYAYYMQKYYECSAAGNCDTETLINDVLTKFNITMEELEQEFSNGITTTTLLSQQIKVYDIISNKYNVDKTKKEIVCNESFDKDNITLTLEGLTGEAEDNKYIIKDGDTIVDSYTIVINKKTEDKKERKKEEKQAQKKLQNSNVNKALGDIYLTEDTIVNAETLKEVKGTDRNIILEQDDITFTINGKDIESTDSIDLNASINTLTASSISEEVKDKVKDGVVISFDSTSKLPGKVKVEMKVSKENQKILGTEHIKSYLYKDEVFTLVADDLSVNNNKVSFYIDKLGYYVLTKDEVSSDVYNDIPLIKENANLQKECINYKLCILLFILLIEIILVFVLGILLLKKHKKEKKMAKKNTRKKSKK